MDNRIKLFLSAGKLKTTKRSGWLYAGGKDTESIADHSYRVAFMAMILGEGKGFDTEKLLKMALIHDIGESKIGDLVTERAGAKKSKLLEEKFALESAAIKNIFSGNPAAKEYYALWLDVEKERTPEGKFIREIDKLEMAMQALEYEKTGFLAGMIDEFWATAKKAVKTKELRKILQELTRMRPKKKTKKN